MSTPGETPCTQKSENNSSMPISPVPPPRMNVSGRRDLTILSKHDSTGKQPAGLFKTLRGKLSVKKTSPQPRETCVLIVNRKHLSEENERAFREGLSGKYLYKEIQEGNKIKFHVEINDLLKAAEAVQKKREIFSKTTLTAKDAQVVEESKPNFFSKSKQGSDMIVQPKPAALAQDKELYTKSGIKVSVYKANITHLFVDAIVNAANGQLNHGGGVAAVISRAAGVNLQLEGDDYVRGHGPLKVTEVLSTTAGNLPCKRVFHAVGPRWNDYEDKELCQIHLEQTVFNCFKKAHEMKLSSLAVSSISSAIFGVPKEMCARMYLAGIQKFDRQHGSNTSLKDIHFVDVSDEMVGIIQKVFTQLWKGEFQPFLFLRQSKNTNKQNSKPIQINRNKPRQSEFSKNSKRSDVGNVRHFDFKGITLFLKQQDISDVPDDVVMVAWQEPGRLKIETDDWFKIIGSSSSESIPRFENINEGDVKIFTARNGRTILFPAMSSQTTDNTKVSGMLEIILDKVQRESKRSVVIPSSQYVNQTESSSNNNRLEQFCEGIYKGIQRYSENRFVYVTVDNADILEAMAEKIRLLHGEGMGVEKSRLHEEKHCIDLPRISIVIKQEEAKSESIQRIVNGSVRQYDCKCQSEPRVCLEIISQDINKFIEALKHASKPHPTEKDKPQVDQHQECECENISLDRKKYDALRHLDKDFITSNFTEVNEQQEIENSVVVTLRPNTTSHGEQLQLLLSSLRIEEMKLLSDEFEKFTRSSDISSTDRDFVILSQRNEGKLTVYARNYEAMTKANHIISLKTGKIKITTREQRKFSTTSATSDRGESQPNYIFDVTHDETKSAHLNSEKTRLADEIDNSSGTRL